MVQIREVTEYLESLAPLHLQEDYDNCGLLVGDKSWEVTGILTTLDTTEAVVDEAVAKKCNLIVSHHPIIFKGLKTLVPETYVQRTVIKSLKKDIAIYAVHTNLDNVLQGGVNQRIGTQLGLTDLEILQPKDDKVPEIGSGAIGKLPGPLDENGFLKHLKKSMNCEVIRHTQGPDRRISNVALCGGSGSFLLKTAISRGADAFVSADFKYHEFFDAEDKILLADIGHFESEQFTRELLADMIRQKFRNFAVHFSERSTNPINYFY